MAVYTKKGDRGKTSLYGENSSRFKYDLRIWAIGSIDELNSCLGFVNSFLVGRTAKYKKNLVEIQKDLFEIASCLGTPTGRLPFEIGLDRVRRLEKIIDELEGTLPTLSNFIFPGGSKAGSALHVARSVCRRAEREIVKLAAKEKIEPNVLVYMNRLSDCLFMIAREVNRLEKKKEEIWRSR